MTSDDATREYIKSLTRSLNIDSEFDGQRTLPRRV